LGSGNGLRVGDFNTIGGGQIYATSNIIRWWISNVQYTCIQFWS
jgi:hypothetical protein